MILSHHRSQNTTSPSRPEERGYIVAMLGLLLIPLLLMVGLSVDVGGWYNRASEVQKAADAAALAGVVWLPDIGAAESHAQAAAERNGYPSSGDTSVSVERVGDRRLRVTIEERNVGSFFYGAVGGNDIDITRSATAEYVLPVPLGSPDNRFGNDPDLHVSQRPNFWAAINGPYMNKESGDPYSTRCQNPGSQSSCNYEGGNPEYRDFGYYYAVEVPQEAVGEQLTVQIYDAPYRNSGSSAGDGPQIYNANYQRTSFELFEADATQLDHTDNPSMAGECNSGPGYRMFTQGDSTGRNSWYTLCRINAAKEGMYVLQVKSGSITGHSDTGTGNNAYAVRATMSGSDQPSVYGIGDMSIFTNSVGSVASFYLAEVDPVHAGKTFELRLFDPGDGNSGTYDLSILMPDGSVADCRYTDGEGNMGSNGPCTIRTRDPWASPPNIYNNKWLTIEIPLADGYDCDPDSATGCWWRVSYDFGSGEPTDRTTWAARIIGDPVHLVED